MFRNKKLFFAVLLMVIMVGVASMAVSAEKIEEYIPNAVSAEEGMTLWQVIKSGGEVMIVLAFLSIAALGLVIYYFLVINQEKLLPDTFRNKMIFLIESKKYEEAKIVSQGASNLLSDVIITGLSLAGHEKAEIEEAVQDEGRRGIASLWQKLSYLADIAAVSPMVGLLGTVLGMIQAFNVIAFQTGAVKPILLASGISKAMVTTATGLMIAIPAMIFYSYFRGRIQGITSRFEHISTEFVQAIAKK